MSKVVNNSKRLPWICGVFGVAACLLALLPVSVLEFLQYDRERILAGELWRLFTGHFVHWTSSHLLWDVAVFVACGLFLEWIRRRLLALILLVGPVLISGALILLQPDMATYRGLSALDMSLFAAVCLQAMSYCKLRNKQLLWLIWGFALFTSFLKPVVELFSGGALFVSNFGDGIQTSPLAHMLGVLVAVAAFKTISFWETFWDPSDRIRNFRTRKLSGISTS